MRQRLLAAALLCALPLRTWGHDPAHDEYDQWYESLSRTDGMTTYNCCSKKDCRPAVYRMSGGGLEVFIDRKSFGPDAPNDWVPVPDAVVIRQRENPTGEAVACWTHDRGIICFVPSNAT